MCLGHGLWVGSGHGSTNGASLGTFVGLDSSRRFLFATLQEGLLRERIIREVLPGNLNPPLPENLLVHGLCSPTGQ